MKAFVLTFFILLTTWLPIVCGQSREVNTHENPALDSLLVFLEQSEDTLRVQLLNEIGYRYYYIQPDKTLEYASESVQLAEKINFRKGLAEAQRLMGIGNQINNRHKECMEWLFKALLTSEEIGFDQGIADSYNSIGVLYSTINDWNQAILFFQKSLKFQRKTKNTLREAIALSNIGECFLQLGDLDSAGHYINTAQGLFEKLENEPWIAMNLVRVAKYQLETGNYTTSILRAADALVLSHKHNQQFHLKEAYHVMGKAQYYSKNYTDAEKNTLDAIFYGQELGFIPAQKESYELLYKIYQGQGNYKKAFETLTIFMAYKDSLHLQQDKYNLDHLSFEFELEQKEKDYLILKTEKERHEAENMASKAVIQRQNMLGTTITIFLFVFAISALVFFKLRQKERKANEILSLKNDELKDQKKELTSTLQVIKMLNSQIEAQNNTMKHVAIVSITDLNGNIESVNENFAAISGYTREETLGKKHNFLKSGNHPEEFYKDLWKTINSGETWRGEICNKTKTGKIFWTDTAIAPILDENNRPKQYFSLQFEISKRKEYEEQLQAQKKELADLNQLKDKLFSVISHDFRSPLRSLKGTLALYLRGAITPDEMNTLAGDLAEKLDITSNMLDNLLNWAKSQMKGIHVEKEPTDLYEITADSIEFQKMTSDKKKIHIKNKLSKPTEVMADSEMIKLVLRNLVSNAIKFSNVGDTVTINALKENGQIITSVEDEGVGMDFEKKKKLFSFSVASSPGTSNESGIGIGLALCKDFIEKNDGDIWVESKENKGSIFYFSLPVS